MVLLLVEMRVYWTVVGSAACLVCWSAAHWAKSLGGPKAEHLAAVKAGPWASSKAARTVDLSAGGKDGMTVAQTADYLAAATDG